MEERSTPSSTPPLPRTSIAPIVAVGGSSGRPEPRIAWVFSLLSVTLGWSKGLMPSTRPATAVAYSQPRNWAPSGPVTASDGRRPGRRRRRRPAGRVAGGAGRVGGLDDDGQDAAALLAGGLGDELLGPVAEAVDAGAGVGEGQLVAALRRSRAQRGAELQRGVARLGERAGRAPRPGRAARRRRRRPAPTAPGRTRTARCSGRPRWGRRGTPRGRPSPRRSPTAASPGR